MSEAVADRRVVAAAPDVVFDVIVDIESYPRWQDDVKTVEVLDRDERGRPARARFVVDARLFQADYTLGYTYDEHEVSWQLIASDQLRTLDGSYTVTNNGDGTSTVTYQLDADPAVSIPGFMRRSAAQRIVRSALDDLKRRVESLA
jgi:ribosome-associated toxin RatA of RatAB toxin-antitoxin module